jgi:ferritin
MSVLSQNIIDKLGAQYKHETANSLRYYQRATYADMIGLTGIAGFFKRQGDGERTHADIVYKYASDRNVILPISGLVFDEPDINMGVAAPVLFEQAMKIENDTTIMLEIMLTMARQERDYLTEQWLLDTGGLLREQVEEMNLIQTILDRIGQMAGSPSLVHDLDTWVEALK